MKRSLIYLGSFTIMTLAMALLLHTVSQEGLGWRDSFIIGGVFGALVPLMLWGWERDRRANRRLWNIFLLVTGRR